MIFLGVSVAFFTFACCESCWFRSVSAWPLSQGASHRCADFNTMLRISRLNFLKHVPAIAPTPFMPTPLTDTNTYQVVEGSRPRNSGRHQRLCVVWAMSLARSNHTWFSTVSPRFPHLALRTARCRLSRPQSASRKKKLRLHQLVWLPCVRQKKAL